MCRSDGKKFGERILHKTSASLGNDPFLEKDKTKDGYQLVLVDRITFKVVLRTNKYRAITLIRQG